MAIEVDEVRADWWLIVISGSPICGFGCEHMARRHASKFSEAREAGPRRAMHIFTHELGMCEDYAREVYSLLVDHPTTVN